MNLKQLVIKTLKVAVLGLSLTTAYAFEARVVGVSDGDILHEILNIARNKETGLHIASDQVDDRRTGSTVPVIASSRETAVVRPRIQLQVAAARSCGRYGREPTVKTCTSKRISTI